MFKACRDNLMPKHGTRCSKRYLKHGNGWVNHRDEWGDVEGVIIIIVSAVNVCTLG